MDGRETALITGASMGIGKELAKIFASDGRDLVLVARSEDKLQVTMFSKGIAEEVEGADVTVTAHCPGAIEGLMNWLTAFSVRFSPRILVRKIARWMNKT